MKTTISATATLVWLGFALACTPNQPLPLPSNPATAVKACPDTACSSGQVCNRAIGGGTCTAPCTSDAGCAAIESDLVCHPQASGGVCAPDCSTTVAGTTGDQICQALDPTLACTAGRCAPAVASGSAEVRFFLATSDAETVTITANTVPPLSLVLAAGVASAYTDVAAGTYAFTFDFGALAGSPLIQSITVSASAHYTVPIFDTNGSAFDTQWFTDDSVYTPPGSAALRYFQACRGLGVQAISFDAGAGAQPVIGGVAAITPQNVVDIPAQPGIFEVGPSAGSSPTMLGSVTLTAGLLYTALSWCDPNLDVPQTTLLSPADPSTPNPPEPVANFAASGFRLLNASDLAQLIVTFDDDNTEAAVTQGFATLAPATKFDLVSPGPHTVKLYRDFSASGGSNVIASVPQTFDPGTVYSILVGGQSSIPTPNLTVNILSESVDTDAVSATQAVARLIDYAPADTTDTATLFLGDNETGTQLAQTTYLSSSSDVVFDASAPNMLTLTLGANVRATPQLVFTPQSHYTAIATGTAVSGAQNAITFWVVGPNAQVALVTDSPAP